MTPSLILRTLETVRHPGTGKNIVEAGMVGSDGIIIGDGSLALTITFPKLPDPFQHYVSKTAEAALRAALGEGVEIEVKADGHRPEPQKETLHLPEAKHIIAVSSGKGGVGKSTVAANLAVALAREGYRVGLLDADVFGPSQPKMFHLEHEQLYMTERDGRELIIPAEKYGVRMLSIGFLVAPGTASIWRGGMASNWLKQLIVSADWGELDYLLIDTPPGTSDIHLTLLDVLPITGALIVTTPQEVALADARKGINMYQNPKVAVPILGLVENMAWFTPEDLPDRRYYVFGRDGGRRLAEEYGLPLLGQIPLVQGVAESGDGGEPIVLTATSPVAQAFTTLARSLPSPPAHRGGR